MREIMDKLKLKSRLTNAVVTFVVFLVVGFLFRYYIFDRDINDASILIEKSVWLASVMALFSLLFNKKGYPEW